MVTEVLELLQLVELDRMPEMEVGPGGVKTFLDSQRLAALQFLDEFSLDDQLVRAAFEDRQLVRDIDGHGLIREAGVSATIRPSRKGGGRQLIEQLSRQLSG